MVLILKYNSNSHCNHKVFRNLVIKSTGLRGFEPRSRRPKRPMIGHATLQPHFDK